MEQTHMADETIEILIKTIASGDGAKVSAQDYERLAAATGRSTEELKKYAEQVRRTEQLRSQLRSDAVASGRDYDPASIAASRASIIRYEAALRQSIRPASMRDAPAYTGPIPPIIEEYFEGGGGGAPPKPPGGGMGYGMRRHYGAVAGQILGMPGLGTAVAVGGIAGGLGAAIIAMEKLIRYFSEWQEKIDRIRNAASLWDEVKNKVQSVGEVQRDLNREQELFNKSLSHVYETVRSTTAQMVQLQAIQERSAKFAIDQENAEFALERVNIMLRNRMNILGQIHELAQLDERIAERTIQREAEAEDRRIARLKKELGFAQERFDVNSKRLEEDQQILKSNRVAAQEEKANQEQTIDIFQTRYDAYEKLKKSALGGMSGRFEAHTFYAAKAGLLALGENLPSNLSSMPYDEIYKFALGKRREIAGLKFFAEEKIREKEQAAKLTEEDMAFRRSQMRTAETDEERAGMELETAEEERRIRQESAPSILQRRIESIQETEKLQKFNAIQGGGSIPGSGGSASAGATLRDVVTELQMIRAQWS